MDGLGLISRNEAGATGRGGVLSESITDSGDQRGTELRVQVPLRGTENHAPHDSTARR